MNIYTSSGLLACADLSSLNGYTRYPHISIVSQYTTERVLEKIIEQKGIKVNRPHRLIGLSDEDGLVVGTFDNGEQVKAKYVIAADGVHSTVRQLLNVSFADPDGETIADKDAMQMVFGDVTFTSPPAHTVNDKIARYVFNFGFFLSVPVPKSPYLESHESTSDGIYRIGFNVPKEDGSPPSSPGTDFFQKYLDKILPAFLYPGKIEAGSLKIDKVLWSTRFRVHAAIADKFSVRLHAKCRSQSQISNPCAVFLIGDAAHIYAPIGGQGMNLGLRDGISLAQVLIKHMELFPRDSSAADKLLEEYASGRYASAINTIHLTKRSMSIVARLGAMTSGWTSYFMWVVRLVFMLPFVTRKMAWEASGLGRA